MRVYISGPISGTQDFRERFRIAAARLDKLDVGIVNPAELYKAMPDAKHEDYLAVCKKMLCTCDAVLVLPGFHESKGCMEEVELARKLNLPVWLDLLSKPPQHD